MIYIDADEKLTTWKHIANAGGYTLYKGRANRGDVVIRWGANHGRYEYPAGVRVLNPRLVMDKKEQGRLYIANGVSHPRIFTSRRQWQLADSPTVLAKPRHGQMGTGIRKFDTYPLDYEYDFVIQEYIPKDREFRAMMVGNIIAFFMEKHQPDNGDFRWNEHRGATWTGVPTDDTLRRKVRDLGADALRAIGYDFGAVDIILKTKRGGYDLYVLETNSRPEFGPINSQRFANAMAEYLRR